MNQLNISDEFDALLDRLDHISPLLMANAEQGDDSGRLTDDTVQAIRESGALKIGLPKVLGGYEFAPRQVIETIARISYADASAGWSFMAMQLAIGTTAAYLGADGVQDLFPDVPGGRYALIAGQGTRLGTAVRTDGGYLLSGHWSFASGIALASHIHSAAYCAETATPLVFTFPKEQATLVDNWDVLGLRATGSIDYVAENVFVPDSHVYEMTTTRPHQGGAVYRMGLANLAGICHVGWALGVGRRMLDELRTLAVQKTGTPNASVDTGAFYSEFAQAECRLRAAHAWATDVWAAIEITLDRGETLDTEQETLARLMLNNTVWSAHDVGQTVYKWAATTALRRGDLQRCFRDLHAGTQHIISGPVVLQNCGRWLSGLAPNAHWVFLDLQDQAPTETA